MAELGSAVDDEPPASDPMVEACRARVDQVLREKWHLDALLGVGGMAAVYAATHRNGNRVAIKMLHAELSLHGHVRSRFLREGYVANRVDHPGAVRVLDDDKAEDGSLFLVMELLEGESFEHRQARLGRLGVDEVLAAADQLLDVLAAAHAKGIVHRDIKPDNVFLTRDGTLKVLDFGIARLRELSTASSATRTGTTMGTPAFMPPEQARGLWDEVDGQSDLWAVGASLFSLLSGKVVHEARTVNEQLLAAMTAQAPAVRGVIPDVPESLAALIDRALAYDKADRWPSAHAMQEAVREAYRQLHDAPISSQPHLTVPPSVIDRTLASSELPGGSMVTTGRAVVSGRTGLHLPSFERWPRGRRVMALAAVAAVAAIAIVVGVAIHSTSRPVARSAAAGVDSSVTPGLTVTPHELPAAPRSVPAPARAPVMPSAIPVTALPIATPRHRPTPRPAKQRHAQSRPAQPKAPVPPARTSPEKQPSLITTHRTW